MRIRKYEDLGCGRLLPMGIEEGKMVHQAQLSCTVKHQEAEESGGMGIVIEMRPCSGHGNYPIINALSHPKLFMRNCFFIVLVSLIHYCE